MKATTKFDAMLWGFGVSLDLSFPNITTLIFAFGPCFLTLEWGDDGR